MHNRRESLRSSCRSVALSVDDSGAVFLIVLSSNPWGGEGAQRGKSGTTLPDSVLSVSRGDDTDFSTSWGQAHDFALESIGKTFVHGGTTGEDDVLAEIFSNINVGGRYGCPWKCLKWFAWLTVKLRLEEKLWACHTNVGWNSNNTFVWHSVRFIVLWTGSSLSVFLFVVLSNVAKLFLNVTNDFELSWWGKRFTSFKE